MQEMIVISDEEGQRLDRFLKRRLPLAPPSFLYKMLRKKNITLKGKKADGSEKVREGDLVTLFLSDETIGKFSGSDPRANKEMPAPAAGKQSERTAGKDSEAEELAAYRRIMPLLGRDPILYEDDNILIVKKAPGILSQKAAASDLSMNEWLRGYLRQKKTLMESKDRAKEASAALSGPVAAGFAPSVCNRLDRNTGGILLCAKSLQGGRALSALIRERRMTKTYSMLVHGRVSKAGAVQGELIKDTRKNHVSAAGLLASKDSLPRTDLPPQAGFPLRKDEAKWTDLPPQAGFPLRKDEVRWTDLPPKKGGIPQSGRLPQTGGGPQAERGRGRAGIKVRQSSTLYRPVKTGAAVTLVEADLITGRSHQLRVHMASIGHPILFDPRYGDRKLDLAVKKAAAGDAAMLEDRISRSGQFLWCSKITFPARDDREEMRGVLAPLAGKSFSCPFPEWWMKYFL